MRVKIGPYKSWIGPWQIAEALCFWVRPSPDGYGIKSMPEWLDKFGTWLAEDKYGKDSWLTKLCQWAESKRNRKVYVRIDKYDTLSMDHTLAYIVLPMLKQLKATKHGAPLVDDSDVPSPLRSTAPGAKDRCEEPWDTDEHFHERWNYVLDEMIWAFEQKIDSSAEDQFYDHGKKIAGEDWLESIRRIKVDEVGLKAYHKRKANGFKLFGKYYENLWD